MKHIVVGQDQIFGPWANEIMGRQIWTPFCGSIIGLWEEGAGPICACLFEDYNGASIMLHIAAEPSKRWMNKEYLWFVFYYPFVQLGVRKIIGPSEASNEVACKFIEHIGFVPEATLKDAAPKGDLIIYTMTEDQCRWHKLKDRNYGQRLSSRPA